MEFINSKIIFKKYFNSSDDIDTFYNLHFSNLCYIHSFKVIKIEWPLRLLFISQLHPNFDITNDRVRLLLFTISRNSLYRDFLIVKGAGICSLYHEIHYIEIRYIKVWVYLQSQYDSRKIHWFKDKSNNFMQGPR